MTAQRSTVIVQRPSHVTFNNPPINLFDPEFTVGLQGLVEAGDEVRVVVFDSADPEYFMAHLDFLRAEEPDLTEHIAQLAPTE